MTRCRLTFCIRPGHDIYHPSARVSFVSVCLVNMDIPVLLDYELIVGSSGHGSVYVSK